MQITRIGAARAYQAPKHIDVRTLRLQGLEATGTQAFWVGLTHFLPGGGAEMDATPLEKVYVVLAGEVTITTEAGAQKLGPLDSCWLAAGEARSVSNETNLAASMLVVLPTAGTAK
jgi:quercetin dioxygenase-like cupin family protein